MDPAMMQMMLSMMFGGASQPSTAPGQYGSLADISGQVFGGGVGRAGDIAILEQRERANQMNQFMAMMAQLFAPPAPPESTPAPERVTQNRGDGLAKAATAPNVGQVNPNSAYRGYGGNLTPKTGPQKTWVPPGKNVNPSVYGNQARAPGAPNAYAGPYRPGSPPPRPQGPLSTPLQGDSQYMYGKRPDGGVSQVAGGPKPIKSRY